MTTTAAQPDARTSENRLLPLIGAFKLLKAVLLFGAAYALHYLRHTDVGETLANWARIVHFDPESHYVHLLIGRATGVSPARLHGTGIGLFVYACLFLTEGVGLLLRKRWAEYFTSITTGLLLPLEVWELFHAGHRAVKVAILVGNLAILAYLIWNLARTRRSGPSAAGPSVTLPSPS